MFSCPTCRTHLVREKIPEGVFWRCPRCEGRSLSIGVARKLLDRRLVNDLWLRSSEPDTPRKRECPMCKHLMHEAMTSPNEHPVHLDVCRVCHGIWFDTHELAHLNSHAPAQARDLPKGLAEKKRMPQKACEIMALYEVEKIRKRAETEEDAEGYRPPEVWWQAILSVLGLPVEEEVAPLQRVPVLTWFLAIVILLAFVLTYHDSARWIRDWGLIPDKPLRQHGLTWISSIFLHADAWHLFGNVYFFLIFADNVEDYLGKLKFLALFFLAAVAGDALHGAFESRNHLPSVGASGALSGIMAFYALQFPRAKICVFFALKMYIRWVRLPAWGAFAIWCVIQALQVILQLRGAGQVSALAHVGGAAAGVLVWMLSRERTSSSDL